jgi:hypothetical protein
MRVMRSAFRMIVGFGLILHGLGSSVLILRGADATGPGTWNPALTAACIIAVVGFVASGIGVLGVYPFDRTRRALVLAASIGATNLGCHDGRLGAGAPW